MKWLAALAVLASAGCASMGDRPPATPEPQPETRMAQAPDTFRVRFETTAGDFVVDDDGSGDVSYTDVRGRVSVPDDD